MLFNYASKEIISKIVYYGPGLCGKTTNIQLLHEKLSPDNRGKLISLATDTDRTLFFDFLPMDLGTVRGFKIRIQLYTVPGQVHYNATRKLVLKGADAVVFVADSQAEMKDQNIESLQNLKQNLKENDLDPNTIPLVLQYNKRDLPGVVPVEVLESQLNDRNFPWYEAVAFKGQGVVETFQGTLKSLLEDLNRKHKFDIDVANVGILAGMAESAVAPAAALVVETITPTVAEEEPGTVVPLSAEEEEEPVMAPAFVEQETALPVEPEIEPEIEPEPVTSLDEPAARTVAVEASPAPVAASIAPADTSEVLAELRGIRQGVAELAGLMKGFIEGLEKLQETQRGGPVLANQGMEASLQRLENQVSALGRQMQEDQGMALEAILGKIEGSSK